MAGQSNLSDDSLRHCQHTRTRCDRGYRRRTLLQSWRMPAFGLGFSCLGRLLLSESAVAEESKHAAARSCILIWLDGGPSHLETFDLKPQAPAEVRGPLEAISTSVPGIQISECLPLTAARMDRLAIIRSMTSPLGEHNLGTHYLLTGYRPTPVLDYPAFLSVADQMMPPSETVLPRHIAVPDDRVGGSDFSFRGFLPSQVAPFSLEADPARADFRVRDLSLPDDLSSAGLDRRRRFSDQLAAWHRQNHSTSPSAGSTPDAVQRAFDLVTSVEAGNAFELNEESPETRRRYGNRSVGQSCLLARRLIERGVRFVTVNYRGWDTHQDLYTRLKEGFTGAKVGVGLIPSLDLALSALTDDLQDRGLLEETLIVVMGEFGRTPKLNTQGGRDHWPRVFSAVVGGAGIPGGQVIGASDRTGESPADNPLTPADLIHTIYLLMGLNPTAELETPTGRPVRLTAADSRPIHQLLS